MLFDSIKGLNFTRVSGRQKIVVLGDNLFPEIVIFWNIILALVEEDGFSFKVFGCPIAEVPFKVCWSFSQKEHNGGGSVGVQIVSIGNFSLKFDIDQIDE